MKESKKQISKIIVILVCVILIAFSVIASVFSIEVLCNKRINATYEKMGDTEVQMLDVLQNYLTEKNIKLDKPVAFVKDNGLFRGRAYVFNVPLTEHSLNYGLNGGTYSAEIVLPEKYNFPTMYRCSVFAPNLGSLLFPADYKQVKLCDEKVYVISFTDDSLTNGSFTASLDKLFTK